MRAVCIEEYGAARDVLRYRADVPVPTPADTQVLIEVHAASVNPVDCSARTGYGRHIFSTLWGGLPLILGRDVSGVVTAVGRDVTGFTVGDEVYAAPHIGCYAEYVVVDAGHLARKPRNISHLEAASLPFVALTTWTALVENAGFEEGNTVGRKIVIPRAAGGVGSFAVQLMKAWGAYVVGLCSASNMELVKSLGADEVIDYTNTDFATLLHDFDCAFDTVGRASDFETLEAPNAIEGIEENFDEKLMSVLKRDDDAVYVTVCAPKMVLTDRYGLEEGLEKAQQVFEERAQSQRRLGRRYYWSFCNPSGTALARITDLVEQGRIRPLIDRVYPLEDMVAAHEYCETKRARGKIIIEVKHSEPAER